MTGCVWIISSIILHNFPDGGLCTLELNVVSTNDKCPYMYISSCAQMAENTFYISVWLHFLYVLVAMCRQAMRKQIERQEENQGNQGIEFP